jgi:hypothetical protein
MFEQLENNDKIVIFTTALQHVIECSCMKYIYVMFVKVVNVMKLAVGQLLLSSELDSILFTALFLFGKGTVCYYVGVLLMQ